MDTENQDKSIGLIVLSHNNEDTISNCISSIERQNLRLEIILVDNRSSDRTVERVKSLHPRVRVFVSSDNLGYAKGNNRGATESQSEIIVFLNPDAELLEGAINALINPILANDRTMTTPMILLPNRERVNACGLHCTPVGISFPRGLNMAPDEANKMIPANGVSGCCFAVNRQLFLGMGGFDESFFMYNEDTDLSWRAHLNGISIETVPAARIVHDYNPTISDFKLSHLERNRLLLLKKNLPFRWAILILPSLIISEIISIASYLRFGVGGLREKLEAWTFVMNTPVKKETGDLDRLRSKLIPIFADYPQVTNLHIEKAAKRLVAILFKINWRVVR